MHARHVTPYVAGLALLLSFSGSAAAEMFEGPNAKLRHGDYNCTTRNGRVLDGRGFTIVDDLHYTTVEGPGGNYEIKGPRVYFNLGELDGKQIRILSSGRIKYSDDIFCVFAGNADEPIPETPLPDEKEPAPGQPVPADTGSAPGTPGDGSAPAEPPPEPPPPKVIKVDPNKPDPRLQSVPPP